MGLFKIFETKKDAFLEFDNFNFKLAIVQELMYDQEILKPKFHEFVFCEEHGIDPEDYAYQTIPQIKEWFEDLKIPRHMAKKVKSLYFDGGNEIYLNLAPIWDGEDDLFTIIAISEAELRQFPNLKTIDGTSLLMTEEVKDFLKTHGVNFLIER